MARYKFEIKKNEISETEINETKNFKKFMHRYNSAVEPLWRKMLFRRKQSRFWISIVLIFVVSLLIIEESDKHAARQIQTDTNIDLVPRQVILQTDSIKTE